MKKLPAIVNVATFQRFSAVCHTAGVDSWTLSAAWENLASHYSEGHRFYHTLSHIDHMFSWLDKIRAASPALELAIWYHDVIYDPRANDNESASAVNFQMQLGSQLPAELSADVARLILATDHRRKRTSLADESLLIDIDLSILAAQREVYESYQVAIRQEYSFVPEEAYAVGRSAVLSHFLSSPIFTNEPFATLEETAVENITRELSLWQNTTGLR